MRRRAEEGHMCLTDRPVRKSLPLNEVFNRPLRQQPSRTFASHHCLTTTADTTLRFRPAAVIAAGSLVSILYNIKRRHPTQETSLVDFDLVMLFIPALLTGITVGVVLNQLFPTWCIILLLTVLLGCESLVAKLFVWVWRVEIHTMAAEVRGVHAVLDCRCCPTVHGSLPRGISKVYLLDRKPLLEVLMESMAEGFQVLSPESKTNLRNLTPYSRAVMWKAAFASTGRFIF